MKPAKALFIATVAFMSQSAFSVEQPVAKLKGNWGLTKITAAGQTVNCPGQSTPIPGAPTIGCTSDAVFIFGRSGKRGTYTWTGSALQNLPSSGTFFTNSFKAARGLPAANYITFDGTTAQSKPQTAKYSLSKDKMTLNINAWVDFPEAIAPGSETYYTQLSFTRLLTK